MTMPMEQFKDSALHSLEWRRAHRPVKVENVGLLANSPMYYYCTSCGWELVLPEDHRCPVPELCHECGFLKSLGWLQ